jgi:hypothetical protein
MTEVTVHYNQKANDNEKVQSTWVWFCHGQQNEIVDIKNHVSHHLQMDS